jgi:dihydropteroate synthase
MGVVNVTPDSFSDGGRLANIEAALAHALALDAAGADILDIGGESTRPGAEPVNAAEEMARTLPLLTALRPKTLRRLSIDTCKPEVAEAAVRVGADIWNDVSALGAPGAPDLAARLGCEVVLMHMQGEPRTMQSDPRYTDVVREVGEYLEGRARSAEAAGIAHERIVLDPGFGFGKTLDHNLHLLRSLGALSARGWPVLVGISRKSMLGTITGRGTSERVHASVAAALMAVINGARIVRVHDVRATRDALDVYEAVSGLARPDDRASFSSSSSLP